jgi:hypothetical protein
MSEPKPLTIDLSAVAAQVAEAASCPRAKVQPRHETTTDQYIAWPPLETLAEAGAVPSQTATNHSITIKVDHQDTARLATSYCFAVYPAGDCAYLHDLWICAPLREQGVGETLRAAVLAPLVEQVPTIYSRPISPGGLALNEKQGFKPVDSPRLDGGWYGNTDATVNYLKTVASSDSDLSLPDP